MAPQHNDAVYSIMLRTRTNRKKNVVQKCRIRLSVQQTYIHYTIHTQKTNPQLGYMPKKERIYAHTMALTCLWHESSSCWYTHHYMPETRIDFTNKHVKHV